MNKKKLIIIILLVVVVGSVGYFSMTANTDKITKVNIESAKKRELVEIVSASGRIQPQTKVDITSEVNGEIINLQANEGDFVEAGELLIVLDTVQLRSNVNEAKYAMTEIEARLEGSKITMNQNKEEYDRQKRLREDNLSSETQLTNAKYAYLNSESSYKAMLAQSKQVKSRYDNQIDKLSKAKIVAPMSGVITFLDCEVGEIAQGQTAFSQGRTLMTISNLNVFEVEVEVDETEINKVAFGQEVDIEVDAFIDTVFAGEVVEIGNTALISGGSQDQSTNFKVKVIFKDSNVRIRPGMSATVDIVSNKKESALSISYSAVVMRSYDLDSLERANSETAQTAETTTSDANAVHAAMEVDDDDMDDDSEDKKEELKGVFVVRDGKAKFVQINTGIANQKNIEVTDGLMDGDSIITGPYKVLRTIKDGDLVEKIKKKKKEEE